MSLGYQSEQIYKIKKHTYTKKTWSQSLSLASRSKGPGIARLVETSNAESPTMIYIANNPERLSHNILLWKMFRMQCIYTPQGVPVALFLTSQLKLRSSRTSKPKRTVTPFYVYVPTLAFPHKGLPARVGFAKVKNNLENKNKIKEFSNYLSRNIQKSNYLCLGM